MIVCICLGSLFIVTCIVMAVAYRNGYNLGALCVCCEEREAVTVIHGDQLCGPCAELTMALKPLR